MKIVLLNRFFFPDTSATSQIATDLSFHLAASGNEVHVITSRVPGGEGESELCNGVRIHRVSAANTGSHNLLVRALAYLRFYLGARLAVENLVRSGDIVIVKTDPPLLSAVIGPSAKRRRAKLVVWLQDVFPEVAKLYGIPGAGGFTGLLLRRLRDRSLMQADCVVSIGERMAAGLRGVEGLDPARVHVIHNWADGNAIKPLGHEDNELRRLWGLTDQFVVEYSGNLGRVHEFETMLGTAALLAEEPGIKFLIVGHGPRLQEVQSLVKRKELANVLFKPHQARDSLSDSLAVADVHLCVLRPEFEGLIQPSKLYGIMAAGRPTIFVGDVRSESALILSRAAAGITVPTGDSEGLARAILALRGEHERRQSMGRNARRVFEESYSRPLAMARWEELLNKLGSV